MKEVYSLKDCMNSRNEFPLQSMTENNVILDRETFKRMNSSVHLLDNKNSKGDSLIQDLLPFKD